MTRSVVTRDAVFALMDEAAERGASISADEIIRRIGGSKTTVLKLRRAWNAERRAPDLETSPAAPATVAGISLVPGETVKQFQAVRDQIDDLERHLGAQIDAAIADERRRHESAHRLEIETWQGRVADLERQVGEARTELEEVLEESADFEQRLRDLEETEIPALQERLARETAAREAAEGSVGRLEKQREELQAQLLGAQEQIGQLTARLDDTEAKAKTTD